ncbi:uncharacterized protein LOC126846425 [Adelges cooleyi]|uniref:uncharacterized protein LOC126846425 n=1 Tax=Adelges cooleyi TaxID=133065 RepID=UPI00217F89AA|nr:uncharacterized protein LOC126846425 [Adelges cooleyi]
MNVNSAGLTVPFAIMCIVDLFGVFPIVVLPGPIIKCGWSGIPLAVCVFVVQVYTAVLLGKCWIIAEQIDPDIVNKNRYPYAALAELVFGHHVKRLVSVMLDVTVFGASIPNLIIAAYNLHVLGTKASDGNTDISLCIWLVIIGLVLCPPLWLGSPKDMKWLASISVFTVSSVCVLTWIAMLNTESEMYVPVPDPTWDAVALAYGILAFQFDVHPLVLTVQMDMVNKQKLPTVVVSAFFITCTLFVVTTVIGYMQFGGKLSSNLLDELPESRVLNADIMLVTLQICMSTVVSTTALFQNIEHYFNLSREFSWKRCALRSSVMMAAVLIGEAVPRFDLVMGLVGTLLTGPLMFILPPILYARIRSLSRSKATSSPRAGVCCYRTFPGHAKSSSTATEVRHLILPTLLVLAGVLATVLATLSAVREAIVYASFTPSCLMQMLGSDEKKLK